MAEVFTVLRSGGEYTFEHVFALARNLRKHGIRSLSVISDKMPSGADVELIGSPGMTIFWMVPPEELRWPGWWMKMAMFSPMIQGNILYMDLDTVIVGNLEPLLEAEGDIVLRDFYRGGNGIGSGLMRLTKTTREQVWWHWHWNNDVPEFVADHFRRQNLGDQAFLEMLPVIQDVRRWQDVMPGAVVSYKVHCRDRNHQAGNTGDLPPEGAAVVCFHGQPRPWDVNSFWIRGARS